MGEFTKEELTKIKAKEAEWKKMGDALVKAKDDELLEPIREAGKAAMRGMEEDRIDAMGNAYKKGGKVKSDWHGFKGGSCGKNNHGF